MPKKAKSKGVGKRGTGSGNSKARKHKQQRRGEFGARHIDQIWEDINTQGKVPTEDNGAKQGPVGTTSKAELDADLPGSGAFYCRSCARYFTSALVLAQHERSKPHKRRVKALQGSRPHNEIDAQKAGNMGAPDNGPRLRTVIDAGPTAMDVSAMSLD